MAHLEWICDLCYLAKSRPELSFQPVFSDSSTNRQSLWPKESWGLRSDVYRQIVFCRYGAIYTGRALGASARLSYIRLILCVWCSETVSNSFEVRQIHSGVQNHSTAPMKLMNKLGIRSRCELFVYTNNKNLFEPYLSRRDRETSRIPVKKVRRLYCRRRIESWKRLSFIKFGKERVY